MTGAPDRQIYKDGAQDAVQAGSTGRPGRGDINHDEGTASVEALSHVRSQEGTTGEKVLAETECTGRKVVTMFDDVTHC